MDTIEKIFWFTVSVTRQGALKRREVTCSFVTREIRVLKKDEATVETSVLSYFDPRTPPPVSSR